MKKYKNVYTVCAAVTLLFFALFTARLINWQLIGGEGYRELASLSGAAEEKSEAVRGQIYDKNGKEIQPDSSVKVSITGAGVGGGEETKLYHMSGGSADKVLFNAYAAEVLDIFGNSADRFFFDVFRKNKRLTDGGQFGYRFDIAVSCFSHQAGQRGDRLFKISAVIRIIPNDNPVSGLVDN